MVCSAPRSADLGASRMARPNSSPTKIAHGRMAENFLALVINKIAFIVLGTGKRLAKNHRTEEQALTALVNAWGICLVLL